ncbi:hypothetical protein GCM10011369_03970 [Neiella marina]|uniref:Periplasmic binding protein domain-containing protein n=1 Tax=Neiella marina TaxID=508461 RepID=A0A8J2U2B0_9GAMM|nr:hypothetical protein GCM10011369_03970 [Neiella marina]
MIVLFSRVLLCCSLLLVLALPAALAQQPVRITLLSPGAADDPFWSELEGAMQVAARQFEFDFKIERLSHKEHNRFSVLSRYQEIIEGPNKPDYFISFFQRGIEQNSLEMFEKNRVHFISINTGLPSDYAEQFGKPGERYQYWLSHVSPDDYLAGKQLMHSLVQQASQKTPDKDVLTALAFGGPTHSQVGRQRLLGMRAALAEINSEGEKVALLQRVFSDWRGEELVQKAQALFKRHSYPDVLWVPSDGTAIDLLAIMPEQAKRHTTVGSFDWSDLGIAKIQQGQLYASIGGHFLDGVWALVIAFDHANRGELAMSETVFNTKMNIITMDNLLDYQQWLANKDWLKADYRRFTKTHNSFVRANGYDFNLVPGD